MKYQITYWSPEEKLGSLINVLKGILPSDTVVQSMEEDVGAKGQVQIVGMELGLRDMDKLPNAVCNYLQHLGGKQLLVFATLPFYINESQRSRVHKAVSQSIPQDCNYMGLFLCSAQPNPDLLEGFRHAKELKPESTRIQYWLKRCEYAVSHPDEKDLGMLCHFAKRVLRLEE